MRFLQAVDALPHIPNIPTHINADISSNEILLSCLAMQNGKNQLYVS